MRDGGVAQRERRVAEAMAEERERMGPYPGDAPTCPRCGKAGCENARDRVTGFVDPDFFAEEAV